MATIEDVLTGVAQAMEDGVADLTTALDREADSTDNEVRFPYGEIVIISDDRYDVWNSDVVGFALDDNDNQIGYILDAKYDAELQLNIWISVPSDSYDIQSLGTELHRYMKRFDNNRPEPETLPDGAGGSLDEVNRFRVTGGGQLPTEDNLNPPWRGYSVSVELRYTDRIVTSDEYETLDYIDTVDIPESGDLTDGADSDEIDIEYNAT